MTSLHFNPIIGCGPPARWQHGFRSYSKNCHFDLMQVVAHKTYCTINSSVGLYRVNGSYKRDMRRSRILAYASGNKHIEDLTGGKGENSNESRQNVDIVVGTSDNFSSSTPVMASDQKSEPQASARNLLATDVNESDSASSQVATQRIESYSESISSPMIAPNSSSVPSDVSRMDNPSIKSQQRSFTSGKLSLSAQEKLRTARTLSGFAESNKPVMPQPGKNLLDALRESDKQGKTTKFGQPVVPSNLFDDKKRGSPAEWGKFVFTVAPGQLFLLLSFLLISSIMFGTTYLVWKLGAIHYNEY
ncbi:uncharacterized protein LOC131028945 [Cryptomeria japonica]|uniref:uncharacterized protein LOC131028945 n=1 Tax=Cryptomeria japonica TaxID=3369 RepID=UPI0025ABB8CC|nr:uncharacterized protein LOC131028945 [Cryptomeria japonica]